ncbi:MAG: DUF3488 and transglutaminase-like domain-containing protein, partial [Phycisphaerales bacterium]|nr:DUF3488 and transglutaminase-like domain-containing protein [Phycisphaerales bacterium]
MTSERRFRRSVLLTALAGQCAYAMAAEKPGLALIALLTAGLSWWLVREALSGRPRPVPRWLLNGLVLTAIVFLVFQLMSRSQEPITSLTDFLAYVMLVKSLDRARMRDEAQLLGLSLFVVIGALLTGQGLGMGVALLAYTPLAIVSTVTLQLYAARERQRDLLRSVGLTEGLSALDTQLERQRAPRAVAVVAVVCAAASMTAGVGAFIVTPRQLAQQLGVASSPFVKSPATDFSDQIQLGSAGTISQDGTPVMDVRLVPESGWAGPRSGPIYLRGAVLTNYDRNSMTWKGASRSDAAADGLGGEVSARNRLTALLDAPARGRTEYEVVLRATRSNADATLFAPLQPVGAATQAEGKIVYRPSDATLRLAPSPGGRVVYTVTCVSDYRDPSRADGVREREASPARIRELALRLLKERSVDADPFSKGPLEVRRSAQAIVAYLGTFPYTLEMIAPPEGVDPIEMFLFDTRRGHCEYFAAGMVAMLRSVG